MHDRPSGMLESEPSCGGEGISVRVRLRGLSGFAGCVDLADRLDLVVSVAGVVPVVRADLFV